VASHINFEAKSDRELLLLVAQQTNDMAERRVPDVESRLSIIEEECKRRSANCPLPYTPTSRLHPTVKTTGIAGVGILGAGGGIWAIVEAIKAIQVLLGGN
jgi:hypothetical protein